MNLILRFTYLNLRKILFLLLLFPCIHTELRFCLMGYGPMRMRDSDCKGGFVFKEAIEPYKIYCKHYAKTGTHTGKVLTAPVDICSDHTDRVLENRGDALEDIRTLTYFLWEENPDEEEDEAPGKFVPEDICTEECLGEWVDRNFAPDDPPIPDNFDPEKLSPDQVKELKAMNREMFMQLYAVDDDDMTMKPHISPVLPRSPVSPPHHHQEGETTLKSEIETAQVRNILRRHIGGPLHPRRHHNSEDGEMSWGGNNYLSQILHDPTQLMVIKVLAKSMLIMLDSCKPYLTEQFLEQALRGMVYISRKFEHAILDLSQDLLNKILYILNHCGLRFHQEFELAGNNCGGTDKEPSAEGVVFTRSEEYWAHRLRGWSFRWGRWHPVMDTAWSAIDFVHNFCYESFMQDVSMMHVYVTSLEGIFSDKVRNLWRLNPPVNNDNFWNTLMQVHDLNITMRNLDACQYGALKPSPFLHSVPRPFLTSDELKRPAPPFEYPDKKGKGWNQSIKAYWTWYERQGGFAALSREFGECFDEAHLEEEQIMISGLKANCP